MRSFATFYNSKTGSIGLNYTTRGTASIDIVPVFQPVSPKDIKKGMKVYDYEKKKVFSLLPEECEHVLDLLQNPRNEKSNTIQSTLSNGQYYVSITHFPGTKDERSSGPTQVSRLVIASGTNHGIGYEFQNPSNKAENVKYYVSITPYEFKVFKRFLENVFTFIACVNAISKYEAIKQYSSGGSGSTNGSNDFDNNIFDNSNNTSGSGGYFDNVPPMMAGFSQQNTTTKSKDSGKKDSNPMFPSMDNEDPL